MDSSEYAQVLKRLISEEGVSILGEASRLPEDRLTRISNLRKKYPEDLVRVAVEQLELRKRAKSKFPFADQMLFTKEGLEQSTGKRVADYHATYFPVGAKILDACCGIGGDAVALSNKGEVLAIDQNPAATFCTEHNFQIHSEQEALKSRFRAITGNVVGLNLPELKLEGFDFAFFDPSRRTDGREGERRRVNAAEDYSPPLSWVSELRKSFSGTAVKVSPAIDDETLRTLGGVIEFISDRGECKEALALLDELANRTDANDYRSDPPRYTAVVLSAESLPAKLTPFECAPLKISPPLEWLIEPDPAVIRAHLLPQIAHLHGASLLEPGIAYLTSEREISSPFATSYKIVETLDFNIKQIQARVRSLGGKMTTVKKRNVLIEPEQVLKSLKSGGDTPYFLVLCPHNGKNLALICEPPNIRRTSGDYAL